MDKIYAGLWCFLLFSIYGIDIIVVEKLNIHIYKAKKFELKNKQSTVF